MTASGGRGDSLGFTGGRAESRLTLLSESPEATLELAGRLASTIEAPATLALIGDLGSGKTAFTRGLVTGLGANARVVSSPTYILEQIYRTPVVEVRHYDAYRLADAEELLGLGIDEHFDRPALLVVEWADRVLAALPDDALRIELTVRGTSSREIVLSGARERWASTLSDLAPEGTGA